MHSRSASGADKSAPIAKDSVFELIFSKKYRKPFWATICILFGNIGYYFLRVHFPMALPRWLGQEFIDEDQYANILSATYAMNILGKPLGGLLIDYFNRPKSIFVACIFITAICAIVVTFIPVYYGIFAVWCLTRLFTSMGKMGVIKLMSSWWPEMVMGTIMGIATVSCSLGEGVAKVTLSQSLRYLSWQQMFYLAVGLATICIMPTAFYVHDTKKLKSLATSTEEKVSTNHEAVALHDPDEVESDSESTLSLNQFPRNGSIHDSERPKPKLLRDIMFPLLRRSRYLLLLLIAVCTTTLRELLGHWSLVVLKKGLEQSDEDTGSLTAIFSVCSALSSLIGGRIIDRVPRRNRGLVSVVYILALLILQICLFAFTAAAQSENIALAVRVPVTVTLIAVSEFMLGPPVSFVDGIFVFELVGVEGVAFASGIVGCFGYVGPAIANVLLLKRFAKGNQWHMMWLIGVVAAGICLLANFAYWWIDYKVCCRKELKQKSRRSSVPSFAFEILEKGKAST